MTVKVRQLTAAQPAAQLPDILLQGLSAHLAANPGRFSAQHAALCGAFPHLNSGVDSSNSSGQGSSEATSHRRQPLVEDTVSMADKTKARSLVALMEELGYEATSNPSAVRAVLSQVTFMIIEPESQL